MKVVWTRRAVRHLVHLEEHIGRDSEERAELVVERIVNAVDLLEAHPEIGRPGRVLGTRELIVMNTSYVIPYRVRRGRIELLAVFHGRQQWPAKL